MSFPGVLAACVLASLPAFAARADWRDDRAYLTPPATEILPVPAMPPVGVTPPARATPPVRATPQGIEPLPAGNATPIAAAACYAGPVSCALYAPQRPGAPCHCRGRTGLYWGKAQ